MAPLAGLPTASFDRWLIQHRNQEFKSVSPLAAPADAVVFGAC
jgi:hypothetical protein